MPTMFEKIYEIKADGVANEMTLRLGLEELELLVRAMDADGIRAALNHLAAKEWLAPPSSMVLSA